MTSRLGGRAVFYNRTLSKRCVAIRGVKDQLQSWQTRGISKRRIQLYFKLTNGHGSAPALSGPLHKSLHPGTSLRIPTLLAPSPKEPLFYSPGCKVALRPRKPAVGLDPLSRSAGRTRRPLDSESPVVSCGMIRSTLYTPFCGAADVLASRTLHSDPPGAPS